MCLRRHSLWLWRYKGSCRQIHFLQTNRFSRNSRLCIGRTADDDNHRRHQLRQKFCDHKNQNIGRAVFHLVEPEVAIRKINYQIRC